VPTLHIPARNIRIENSSDIMRFLHGFYHEDKEKEEVLRCPPKGYKIEEKVVLLLPLH
jgi:hypothetical protein